MRSFRQRILFFFCLSLLPAVIAQNSGGQEVLDEQAKRIKQLMDEKQWAAVMPVLQERISENEKKADWTSFSNNSFSLATALTG